MKLSAKQAAFVREYLIDLNATQAAIRAGYSKRSANVVACRMLQRPHVAAEIQRRAKRIEERFDVTVDRLVSELSRMAFADHSAIVQVKLGHVVVTDTTELSPDQRAAIAEISENETGIRVKLHDKVRAIELLGRHLGMFPTRVELTGRNGGPVRVAEEMTDEDLERIARGGDDKPA